jgi:hypothetical protein
MPEADQIDIFEREKRIEYQNFDAAIFIGVLTIILYYCFYFSPEPYKNLASIIWSIINIIFWFSFRKYLQNFHAKSSIYWVNWNIVLVIAFYIFYDLVFRNVKYLSGDLFSTLIIIFDVFMIIFRTYARIRLGISLRKIKSDFIGLLKELGGVYCYLEAPLFFFTRVFLPDIAFLKNNVVFHIFIYAIYNIPTIILIVIFLRAKKYYREHPV